MISVYSLETGTESYRMGEQLFRRGSVSPVAGEADRLCYSVGTTPVQTVSLKRSGEAACTCGAKEACEHIVAAALMANEDGRLKRFRQEGELLLGEHMLAALGRALPGGESVRVAAVLRMYGDGRVGLGLSVGQERLYAVRSIADLLTCFTLGAPLKLSEKFTYRPSVMRFSREDERLLSLLMNHIPLRADSLRAWEDGAQDGGERERGPACEGRFVLLTGAFLHSVLRYFESHPFVLLVGEERQTQNGIRTVELPLCFSVSMTASELLVRAEGTESLRLVTPDARYVLWEGHIAHLHSAQARVCRLMCQEGSAFRYPAREAEDTLATLLPALATVGMVAPSPELAARLVTAPFKAAAYLDLVNGNVEARVEFRYGDTVLYPFTAAQEGASPVAPTLEDGRMLLRDGQAESELLDFFSDAGFVVRGGRIVLRRSKDILTFCTQGVGELGKLCEVYASNAFEKVKPRRFTARAAFHMRGGKLVLTLLEEGGAAPEILPVLRAIAQRQQYVRLKTGEFLDVRDMSALAPVVQELLDAAALDDPAAGDGTRQSLARAHRRLYGEHAAHGGRANPGGRRGGGRYARLGRGRRPSPCLCAPAPA